MLLYLKRLHTAIYTHMHAALCQASACCYISSACILLYIPICMQLYAKRRHAAIYTHIAAAVEDEEDLGRHMYICIYIYMYICISGCWLMRVYMCEHICICMLSSKTSSNASSKASSNLWLLADASILYAGI
jgi:preprotein translocase subunit SecY